jgi:2,4-dienoyl-CoA reductase-like NADH-dependent reductase (Old Yellow Enzyme family)
MKPLAQLKHADQFRAYLQELQIQLPFDEVCDVAALQQPLLLGEKRIGNRFAVLPMEGWDATPDGYPSPLVERRWQRFGESGAKLIWGGEAVAVRPEGRANPQQLLINAQTLPHLARLRQGLVEAHQAHFGAADDLLIGLQLTHSGRFARPYDKKRMVPQILYHHPLLDKKFGLPEDYPLLSDGQIQALIADFIQAATLAAQAGFEFVDIKHCHGYLGHEFLSAVDRPGPYGGSFENRTRFLREVVAGIRAAVPQMQIGVRLSAFDWLPFRPGQDHRGEPEAFAGTRYPYAFGGDGSGLGIDLSEPHAFLELLQSLDIRLVCLSAGSPYYNPHIQRPAFFPPSDGYQPPEDPLMGVARQLAVTATLKKAHPALIVVGTGYSYLQEWLPQVASAVIHLGMADSIGLGRMMLAYPTLVADLLEGKPLQRKLFCRTFSDCTTAPRHGMVSGCYPLDNFYKTRPEMDQLLQIKQSLKSK